MLAALWLMPGLFLGQMEEQPPVTAPLRPPVPLVQPLLGSPVAGPDVGDAHDFPPAILPAPDAGTPALPEKKNDGNRSPARPADADVSALTKAPVDVAQPEAGAVPAEPERPSIFARPQFSDRSSMSWIIDAGPGRFNIIDWESQPSADRLWWLGRWPSCEQVQLHAGIGFNIHWWSGPTEDVDEPVPHLWPRVYDLYLDAIWAQRWTDRFVTEVRARPGLYGDFRVTPPDAFRVPGHAVGVFQMTPLLHLVGGIEHLQRNDVQILPIAGVLWQPTPGSEFRLVFPEPKVAFELSSNHHLWGYVAAEYGGGRWTTKDWSGHSERVEYSDYRVTFGVEWRGDYVKDVPILWKQPACFIELGYVFERHLRFTRAAPDFEPDSAWMIRFGGIW